MTLNDRNSLLYPI